MSLESPAKEIEPIPVPNTPSTSAPWSPSKRIDPIKSPKFTNTSAPSSPSKLMVVIASPRFWKTSAPSSPSKLMERMESPKFANKSAPSSPIVGELPLPKKPIKRIKAIPESKFLSLSLSAPPVKTMVPSASPIFSNTSAPSSPSKLMFCKKPSVMLMNTSASAPPRKSMVPSAPNRSP